MHILSLVGLVFLCILQTIDAASELLADKEALRVRHAHVLAQVQEEMLIREAEAQLPADKTLVKAVALAFVKAHHLLVQNVEGKSVEDVKDDLWVWADECFRLSWTTLFEDACAYEQLFALEKPKRLFFLATLCCNRFYQAQWAANLDYAWIDSALKAGLEKESDHCDVLIHAAGLWDFIVHDKRDLPWWDIDAENRLIRRSTCRKVDTGGE
ncbi:hypothetical protein EBZ39_09855 [bacterium]|nr:hypothetical protein [bacterium]